MPERSAILCGLVLLFMAGVSQLLVALPPNMHPWTAMRNSLDILLEMIRSYAVKLWERSAKARWFEFWIIAAFAGAVAMSEYALAILCAFAASFGAFSMLWHSNAIRFWKLTGSVGILMMFSYCGYIAVAEKGDKGWSHLFPKPPRIKLVFKESPLFTSSVKEKVIDKLSDFQAYFFRLEIPVSEEPTNIVDTTSPAAEEYRQRSRKWDDQTLSQFDTRFDKRLKETFKEAKKIEIITRFDLELRCLRSFGDIQIIRYCGIGVGELADRFP
jgi:hypothetical protein